jgi:serine/threonine protein kinase
MVTSSWMREYQDGQTVPGTPYCVVRLIGAGGMGSVYEVEHIELGRRYVLKSLLRSLATREDLIARMRNEWRSLGKLRHPNIVDVINAGITATQVPYFVMEYLDGETVRDRLERRGKLSVGEAVRIAQGSLLGLAAAHAIGVIHRDVKPANVFLTRAGGVKVLDFGIAQTRVEGTPKITGRGLAIGTPRYMSPEQAAGERADARSDVYAVGLLLYEMLTGEGPFDDLSDATQQMLAHLHRPPRPLSEMVDVPPALEAVVERALSKRPTQRPRSAEYMAAELMPFAAVETTTMVRRGPSISSPTPSTMAVPAGFPSAPPLSPAWEQPTKELKSTESLLPQSLDGRDAPARARRSLVAASILAAIALVAATGGIFLTRARAPVELSQATLPLSTAREIRAAAVTPRTLASPTAMASPPSPLPLATVAIAESADSTGKFTKTAGAASASRRSPRRPRPSQASPDTAAPLDVAQLPPSGL